MKDEKIKRQLKLAGLKATASRLLILGSFTEKCQPLTVENIYRKLKKSGIDLVTVYRNLASFEKFGILRKVDLHTDAQFYELNEHHHHHLVCTHCGVTENFVICGVGDIAEKVLNKSLKFKAVQQHSLELFGVCKDCVKS